MTPLGKSNGTVEFEIFSAVEVTLQIEVIVDGRMDSDQLLQISLRIVISSWFSLLRPVTEITRKFPLLVVQFFLKQVNR